jgi:hypothetical protein
VTPQGAELAEDVMMERAYGEACYFEQCKITLGYGLGRIPNASWLRDLMIARYKSSSGVKGTVATSEDQPSESHLPFPAEWLPRNNPVK